MPGTLKRLLFLAAVLALLPAGGRTMARPPYAEPAAASCPCPEDPSYPAALCREDAAGFSDDFSTISPRWNWGQTEGSGFHRRVVAGGAPAVMLGIGAGGGPSESDCSLEEKGLLRRRGRAFFRLRAGDANADAGAGTMGWGVWRPGDADKLSAAWFLSCTQASGPGYQGFKAMVIVDGRVLFSQGLAADVTRVHDYEIALGPDGARFLVDGRIVAESGPLPVGLPCMKTVCWIDNKVVRNIEGRAGTAHERALVPKSIVLFRAGFRAAGK